MRTRKILFAALLAFVASGLIACYPRVVVHSVIPPQVVMKDVRTVAVLPFSPRSWGGREGLVLADLLANSLSTPQAMRLFSVVEQSAQSAEMRAFSMRRAYQNNELTGFGRRNNAQALIVGRITSYYVRRRFWRKREVYYRDGEKFVRRVRCLRRTGYVGATMRIVNASSGAVMHSVNRLSSHTSSGCGGARRGVLRRHELLDRALHSLARTLANPLVPEVRRMVVPIETGGKDKRLDIGVKFARKSRWRQAAKMWRMVLRTNPRHHKALYNMGVAAEVNGQLRRARRLYRRAERLAAKNWYMNAVKRVTMRLHAQRDMRRLSAPAQPKQTTITPADDPTAPLQTTPVKR